MPRLPSLLDPPLAFAHRGASAVEAENTLLAFHTALGLGATGIESDVWLTADGVPVLTHSGRLSRRDGGSLRRRRVVNLSRSQLPEHVPELAELLELAGTDVEVSLDVKDAAAFDAVLAEARSANVVPRVWLCHPDLERLVEWRGAHDDLRLVNSTSLARIKEGPEPRAAALADAGIDALNLRQEEWTGGLATLLHRFGRYGFAWDAQFERQLDAVLEMGVDAVYSDHVDRMVSAVERAVGRRS